jgi:extensin-like protein
LGDTRAFFVASMVDAAMVPPVSAKGWLGALAVALVAPSVWADAPPAAAPAAAAAVPAATVPEQGDAAHRYANLSNDEAYAELDRRGIQYEKLGTFYQVRAPIRLRGRLHGVEVHSVLPPEERAKSPFEVLDARLALALDDFCTILEQHDIVELVHYTMYRPNVAKPGEAEDDEEAAESAEGEGDDDAAPPKKKSKKDKEPARKEKTAKKGKAKRDLGKGATGEKKRSSGAKHAQKTKKAAPKKATPKKAAKPKKETKKDAAPKKHKHGKKGHDEEVEETSDPKSTAYFKKMNWAPPGTRHPAGLAIDVGALRKRDGTWLRISQHFQGRVGAATCGTNAHPPATDMGRELWALACEASSLGLFTYVLTPNYDASHVDHFHMEIRGDVPFLRVF